MRNIALLVVVVSAMAGRAAADTCSTSYGVTTCYYGVALQELRAAKARLTGPDGLRERVERLLKSLPAGRLTADEVARLTGISRRTLVRRLSEAGTSYRDLLDAELRIRAERLLRGGELSHAQIAEQLGYTDPSSFSRACRRRFRGPARPTG